MNTTEAALRDALEKAIQLLYDHVGGHGGIEELERALSQPSPASSTVAQEDKHLRAIRDEAHRANDVIRLNRHREGQGMITVATALHRIERWAGEALSPLSGEPASVAVEAEARLLDIAAERAAQIRSSCFDYCTGDCNCAQAAESAVDEMERLIAALLPHKEEGAPATTTEQPE